MATDGFKVAHLGFGALALLAMCGKVVMKSGDAVVGVARHADVVTSGGRAIQHGSDLSGGSRLLRQGEDALRSGDGIVANALEHADLALDVIDVVELGELTTELLFEAAGELAEAAPAGPAYAVDPFPGGVREHDCVLGEVRGDGLQPVRCTDRLLHGRTLLAEATWSGLRATGKLTCDLVEVAHRVAVSPVAADDLRTSWTARYTPANEPHCSR